MLVVRRLRVAGRPRVTPMDYSFASCFVDTVDPLLVAELQGQWPRLRARKLWFPITGYFLRFPDRRHHRPDGEAEAILNQQRAASKRIPEISANHPEVNFLWVEVDCAGGTSLYSGYHCRHGQMIYAESVPVRSPGRLFASLSTSLGDDQLLQQFTRIISWFS